jgi:hypothetical protein
LDALDVQRGRIRRLDRAGQVGTAAAVVVGQHRDRRREQREQREDRIELGCKREAAGEAGGIPRLVDGHVFQGPEWPEAAGERGCVESMQNYAERRWTRR